MDAIRSQLPLMNQEEAGLAEITDPVNTAVVGGVKYIRASRGHMHAFQMRTPNMNIKTVLDLFVNQVDLSPDGIALVNGQETLTYGELAVRSDAVGRFLLENGVKRGALVPIEATRSIDYIVAIIGVLKANDGIRSH
jgi:non-ribosomal peptide synthetase component F